MKFRDWRARAGARLKEIARSPLSAFGLHANAGDWDLTALLNAADPEATLPDRHIWLIRLLEWVRRPSRTPRAGIADLDGATAAATPMPILRIRHLLNVLDKNEEHRANVGALLARFWREIDASALLADVGLAQRIALFGEIGERLRSRLLPASPATTNLADLFPLLFPEASDATWLEALDQATLSRLTTLFASAWEAPPALQLADDGDTDEPPQQASPQWRQPFLNAILFVTSGVLAAGFSSQLRQRMSRRLLADSPFRQLPGAAERVVACVEHGDADRLLQEVQYLRALLDKCSQAAASVSGHLEDHGVSVDVVFEVDQLQLRTLRIDDLLTCVVSQSPQPDIARLLAQLVRSTAQRRSIRALFARHYSMLARKVAERGAESGALYITRDRAGYMAMFRAAFGGGTVLAVTTFIKFMLTALALSAFWAGFLAGVNYAISFVLIYILHWTVATKQPAMTAPAMAEKLADVTSDSAVESFVDEVAHLLRSQSAGIFGNLFAVTPVVLAVQWGFMAAFGAPLVGHDASVHVLDSLTLLGPTALYAAFTGVLLFASSMIAGWVENWFVWHRLDTAIQYNPGIVAQLGAARAHRWGAYWRLKISAIAANVSLGMMLGLVPAIAAFFGLPIEVRHVTLSTGQLAAAVGSEGFGLLHASAFWWCLAGIAVTGALNLAVSFFLAFKVALRSRGIQLRDRGRIYAAIRRRLRRRPASFLVPPRS
ncbi:site-specific recombinase [soil metagenome]